MDKKIKTIIILGVVILVVAFFGIPSIWKTAVFSVLGVAVVVVGLSMKKIDLSKDEKDVLAPSKPYSDNGDDQKEEEQKRLDVKADI